MSLIADFSYNIFIFYAFTFSCFGIYGWFSDPLSLKLVLIFWHEKSNSNILLTRHEMYKY